MELEYLPLISEVQTLITKINNIFLIKHFSLSHLLEQIICFQLFGSKQVYSNQSLTENEVLLNKKKKIEFSLLKNESEMKFSIFIHSFKYFFL